MNLKLVDGGTIPILSWKDDFAIIEKMFFDDLEDVVAYENDEGVVLPVKINYDTVECSRRRIYLQIEEELESDSGTLPEQEESDESSLLSDLASEELAAFDGVEFDEEEDISTCSD